MCTGSQTEEEMFLNKETPNFLKFLSILGEEITEDDPFFFRGFHEKNSKVIYTSFRGYEFVFNVTTRLNSHDQRKLIGNNKINFIFLDGNQPL